MKLVEGKEIIVQGVVTRSNYHKGSKTYYFTDGEEIVELIYHLPIESGSPIKVTGVVENHHGLSKIKVTSVENLDSSSYLEIQKTAENSAPINEIDFLVRDKIMDSLKTTLLAIARRLHASQKLKREIIVRFHNDGDGISGALSLSSFLKADYTQQNSAIYSVKDAMNDLSKLNNSNHPLVVLVDFGSNVESKDALELLKAAAIEVIIIDHHPTMETISEYTSFCINPWKVANPEIASKYTAGYLASEISRILGKNNLNYAKIALCSDKSDLIEFSQEDKDSGIVLNYVAAYSSYRNALDFYSNVLEKKELFQSILIQANEKIDKLVSLAKHQIKEKEIGPFKLFYLNLGTIVKKFEFPGLGKSATQVFESLLDKDSSSILVCYGPRTVVFRITEPAFEKGADAVKIIEHLKKTMPTLIISGGGHSKAAALRIKEGFETSVLGEVESILISM